MLCSWVNPLFRPIFNSFLYAYQRVMCLKPMFSSFIYIYMYDDDEVHWLATGITSDTSKRNRLGA